MNPIKLLKLVQAWNRLQSAWKEYQVTKEPVMIGQVVSAAAVLLALVGFDLTQEQVAAVAVVGSMVAGWIARARVSPVGK